MGANELRTFSNLNKAYQENPPMWMNEILGVKDWWPHQHRITEAIVKHDLVLVYATHSISKTYTMGRIALWFYSVFSNSIVITTAPTFRQVKDLLWGEIRDGFKSARYSLTGKLLDTELKFEEKWYMKGFSPRKGAETKSKEQQGSSFQGYHSDHVLIIFDEAVGITHDIWVMAEGLLTSGKKVKWVCIANPTTRSCEFFERSKGFEWFKVKISCFDSPNMIANGFTNKDELELEIERLKALPQDQALSEISAYKKPVPYLLTAQWVVSRVSKWGMEHPLSLSKAFGEFPEDDEDSAIKYSHVQLAINRSLDIVDPQYRYIGIDPARFGPDKSVITDLIDYIQDGKYSLSKRKTTEVSGKAIRVINDSKYSDLPTKVLIDCTGIGSGVHDELLEAQRKGDIPRHVEIYEIHFGQRFVPKDTDNETKKKQLKKDSRKYFNLKSKIFDKLGQDMEHKLSLFPEDSYLEELPMIMFSYDTGGRIVIESKKDFKKRTNKPSPDDSDSLGLANLGRHMDDEVGTFIGQPKQNTLRKTTSRKNALNKIRARIKSTEY